jgi:hypothetical protein
MRDRHAKAWGPLLESISSPHSHILLPNIYHNPAHDPVCKLSEKELQEGFNAIYEDLYCVVAGNHLSARVGED